MQGVIGAAANCISTFQNAFSFAGQASAAANQSCTVAAVFTQLSSIVDFFGSLLTTDSSGSGGFEFMIKGGSLGININGGTQYNSGLAVSIGVPYFAAASLTGLSTIDFLLMRLDTGQTQIATIASAALPSTSNPTFSIGQIVNTDIPNSAIAAAMYSPRYIGIKGLLAFAQDPWSFWYPQGMDLADMVKAGLAASRGLFYNSPLTGLGAGGSFFPDRLAS
jgi:hypothetical protein